MKGSDMGRVVRKPRQPQSEGPQREIAWKAVREFHKMLPTLTGFARSLTGNNKVSVRSGQTTQTDGQVITIRPPLALGQNLSHERSMCDERDEMTLKQLCPACARNEEVWVGLYHEMSHIMLGSFEKPNEESRQAMHELIAEWHPKDACDHADSLIRASDGETGYLSMFNRFSNYTWILHQALDDARIDGSMLLAKPGLREAFSASSYQTFANGLENADGTRQYWSDAPVNTQVSIGILLMASGYSIEDGWLRPEVIEVLNDDDLYEIINNAASWDSVHETADRVIKAFRRLNEMGVCVVDKCVPPEPTPPSLNNEHDEEKSDDAEPDSGDGEPDEDSGDGSPGSSGGDGSGDDPGEDAQDESESGDAGEAGGSAGGDGQDSEGGSADDQPDEESVPDDGGDDGQDLESGHGSDEAGDDQDDTDGDGGSDKAGIVGPAGTEGAEQAGDDETEEGVPGDDGSSSSDKSAGSHGDDATQVGTGDIAGEPVDQDEDASRDDPGAGSEHPVEVGTESGSGDDDEEPAATGVEEASPLGEEVWDEQYDDDGNQPVRSIPAEEMGDAETTLSAFEKFSGHEEPHTEGDILYGEDPDEVFVEDEELMVTRGKLLNDAIVQSGYFDRASTGVGSVVEYEFPTRLFGWIDRSWQTRPGAFMPSEQIIGKALMQARIVFAANKRSRNIGGLTSGKVNSRVLGRRAALGDDRLFKRREVPGKRDYVVGITVDVSGSMQSGTRMERVKRAVFAKAELLNRLGVKFYITAHTGGMEGWWRDDEGYLGYVPEDGEMENLMILWVKKVDEPWNTETRKRLAALQPLANNFDGHTLEFHRKILERRPETDKILIYYTDGAMPAANHDEELVILTDELAKFKKLGITPLAVGINTNSPARYGFHTVRVDSDDDLMKVVEQLKHYLL
jgi:cobalamin biosynthesis protein CobT